MDSLSRVNEPVPDIAAAERVEDARRQAQGRPKGAARRRPKKGEPRPTTASGDRSESHAEQDGSPLSQTSPGEEAPADQEMSGTCYGQDRTIAPTVPSKGRLIDIAI